MIKPDEPWPRCDGASKRTPPHPPTVEYVGRRSPPSPPPMRTSPPAGQMWGMVVVIAAAVMFGVFVGLHMGGA